MTHQFFNNRSIPKTCERVYEAVLKNMKTILTDDNFEPWCTLENNVNLLEKHWNDSYASRVFLDRVIEQASYQIWNTIYVNNNGLNGNVKKAEQTADNNVLKFQKLFR